MAGFGGMLKNKVQGLFGSRAPKEPIEDPSASRIDWAAPVPGPIERPKKSISRVSNESFESKLDELDRLFSEEAGAKRTFGAEMPDVFAPDDSLIDPLDFRDSLAPEALAPVRPVVERPIEQRPEQRFIEPRPIEPQPIVRQPIEPPTVELPRGRSRRDTILPWPAPLRTSVDEPLPAQAAAPAPPAPVIVRAAAPAPTLPVPSPVRPPEPVQFDVPAQRAATPQPLVAGLRSKQDIVNAFKHLLATERAENEAKAKLVPGQDARVAEITLPKSINPTTVRLKLEPRTDSEGRTVLSITVE